MKWDGKSRGGVLGHKIFIFILQKFGLSLAYFVLYFVALYFFLFVRKSFNAVFYLFRSRLKYSLLKSLWYTYLNFVGFGKNLIDKVAIMSGKKSHFSQVRNMDVDYLAQIAAAGKGGILISAHIGNFEVGGQLLERLGMNVNVIMHDADHQKLKKYLEGKTEKKSFNIIPIKDDLSHVILIKKALSNNELICVHGDRFMEGADTISIPFLGEEAKFPKGPFVIATRFGAPVSFAYVIKQSNTEYEFMVSEPKIYRRDLQGALSDYVAQLESMVKKYPTQWFNHYHFWKK